MAYTLTATTKVDVRPSAAVARDLGSYTYAPAVGKARSWTNGTGAGAVNKVFDDTRAINASTNDDLDLAGGLTDIEGGTITFTGIKAVYIENTHATQSLTVGGGANPFLFGFGGAAHTVDLPPGGVLYRENPSAAGWAVTAGTGDILRIANGAGAAGSYKIVLLGI